MQLCTPMLRENFAMRNTPFRQSHAPHNQGQRMQRLKKLEVLQRKLLHSKSYIPIPRSLPPRFPPKNGRSFGARNNGVRGGGLPRPSGQVPRKTGSAVHHRGNGGGHPGDCPRMPSKEYCCAIPKCVRHTILPPRFTPTTIAMRRLFLHFTQDSKHCTCATPSVYEGFSVSYTEISFKWYSPCHTAMRCSCALRRKIPTTMW